jgi:hypothetical protein
MTGKIKKSFRNGRHNLTSFQSNITERTRRAARRTDYYIHDNAWSMMAITAGLAFAAGFFLSRANQEMIAREVGEIPDAQEKLKKVNSWEFVHSSLPLALFLWKALQATRQARRCP